MSNKHHERAAAAKADESGAAPASGRESSSVEGVAVSASPTAAAEDESAILRERVKTLEARISVMEDEASTLKNQYLRSLADYENFRKRMFREREDLQKYANFGILGDLVALLDDFDRAIASAEHGKDFQTLHDGILLIRRQIGSALENKYGLTRFESLGKPFDPHVHEAVASENGEVEEAVVSLEFLPGYKLHDRVVRSAKVKVRMPAPQAAKPHVAESGARESGAAGADEAPAGVGK